VGMRVNTLSGLAGGGKAINIHGGGIGRRKNDDRRVRIKTAGALLRVRLPRS